MMTLCFYQLFFSIEREEVESASLSPKDECFDRLTKGNQKGGLAEDLEQHRPPPPPPSLPFCQCKMPETEQVGITGTRIFPQWLGCGLQFSV